MSEFTWTPEDNRCFGCGENPWGLKLDFREEGEWVVADITLDEKYQGFEDIAHGGIVSTLLDEAGSWAVILQRQVYGPSYYLECEFRRPVPVEEKLLVRGQVESERHGIYFARAQVLHGGDDCLATGKVKCKIRHTVDQEV